MSIRKITGSVSFDPPVSDYEEAIQTLGESVLDDCAEITIEEAT